METIGNSKHKARKEHRCDLCHGKIEKGQIYERQFNKFDGDVYTWKNHEDCSKIASKLNMYQHCDEGLDSDTFREIIDDQYYKLLSHSDAGGFLKRLKIVIENLLK